MDTLGVDLAIVFILDEKKSEKYKEIGAQKPIQISISDTENQHKIKSNFRTFFLMNTLLLWRKHWLSSCAFWKLWRNSLSIEMGNNKRAKIWLVSVHPLHVVTSGAALIYKFLKLEAAPWSLWRQRRCSLTVLLNAVLFRAVRISAKLFP